MSLMPPIDLSALQRMRLENHGWKFVNPFDAAMMIVVLALGFVPMELGGIFLGVLSGALLFTDMNLIHEFRPRAIRRHHDEDLPRPDALF